MCIRDSNNSTAFVLEKGMLGFSSGKKENKLGMRASETAELIFDNVRVPDSHRLGEVGDGFKQAMKILDGGRISIAALSLGIAKGAYKAALKYAKERHQFGKSIANFQAINFMLADMATEIEAAELLIPVSYTHLDVYKRQFSVISCIRIITSLLINISICRNEIMNIRIHRI